MNVFRAEITMYTPWNLILLTIAWNRIRHLYFMNMQTFRWSDISNIQLRTYDCIYMYLHQNLNFTGLRSWSQIYLNIYSVQLYTSGAPTWGWRNSIMVSVSVCHAGRPGSSPAQSACFRKVEFYQYVIDLLPPVPTTGSPKCSPCVIMSMW